MVSGLAAAQDRQLSPPLFAFIGVELVPSSAGSSLRRRSLEGAAWTLLGVVGSHVLRLVSSLLLTRLLAPDSFGLMSVVNVLLLGLAMFSDVGLGPNIVQSGRGRDPAFLNTAWTLQIARGVGVWTICCLVAYPLSLFYKEPELAGLIPVAGLAALIAAFQSTNAFTAQRELSLARLTSIELVAQVLALALMVGVANWRPTVWVLVYGALVAAAVKALASHVWLPGIRHRLRWEAEAVRELVGYGRWILLSSALTFSTNSTSSLILGKFVSMSEVGVFAIAVTLAKAVEQAYDLISQRVLLPVYAQIKSSPPEVLRNQVRKIRLAVMALFLPALCVMVAFAQSIVGLLFDPRYAEAGWILRLCALGLIPMVVSGVGPFYLALGNSKLLMWMSTYKLGAYVLAMSVGWSLWGAKGLMAGMVCWNGLTYFADVLVQRRHRIWLPALDVAGFAFAGVIICGANLLWGLR